jgi:iron-sulfur cluster assembly accessory protein
MFGIFRKVSIKVTQDCFQHVAKVCQDQQVLRVGVEPGSGCGGFSYKFEVTEDVAQDDLVFRDCGAAVVIDPESARLMDGAEVDFTKTMIRRAFVVKNNPLAEMTCGCGTSFAPKFEKK